MNLTYLVGSVSLIRSTSAHIAGGELCKVAVVVSLPVERLCHYMVSELDESEPYILW
jgi:hypothetical protein